MFCSNCGQKLQDGAKFCQTCGTKVSIENGTNGGRQAEYSGKVYKCPACGEILKSFEINCPACGHELRGAKASSAVKEFALKLEAIESKREYEKPRGLMAATEALQRISKTDEQKISLIKSFSVPNDKEDLLEFMILAISNMNMRVYDSARTNTSKGEHELTAAWRSKVDQVYEKAKRSYAQDGAFAEIESLYNQCNAETRKYRNKGIIKWVAMFGWIPVFFAVLIIALNISGSKGEAAEIRRLESIVQDVQEALDNKEYRHALRIADSIDYQKTNAESEREWDIQREYWVDKVLDAAHDEGVDLEYTPSPDVDNVYRPHESNTTPASEDESDGTLDTGFVKGFKDALLGESNDS